MFPPVTICEGFDQSMKERIIVGVVIGVVAAVLSAILLQHDLPWWWAWLRSRPLPPAATEQSTPTPKSPSPIAESTAKPTSSPQIRQVQPIVDQFELEEDQSGATADGALRVNVFKIFAGGAAFTFDIDGSHNPTVQNILIGNETTVHSRGNNYIVRLLELRSDRAKITVSHFTPRSKLHSKLLIKGSYNEVYFYWDPNVTVRTREPFTVTTENEHTHVALPDNVPVEIEFAGHDNTVWCHDGSMVGSVVGNGINGNHFQVRKDD